VTSPRVIVIVRGFNMTTRNKEQFMAVSAVSRYLVFTRRAVLPLGALLSCE
jgi:hypothetical protein